MSAAGAVGLKLNTSTGTMIERVAAGEYILGYDVIGSYVLARTKTDPNVGIVLPKDYTIAISRVALIAKDSKRPNAAKVFLDYLLSKRGQEVMAQQALLYALRSDAQGEATPAALSQELGNALKPVQMGAGIPAVNVVSANPKFVNAAMGNFALQPDSPAIDADFGVALSAVDLLGTATPQGVRSDIGAFELHV